MITTTQNPTLDRRNHRPLLVALGAIAATLLGGVLLDPPPAHGCPGCSEALPAAPASTGSHTAPPAQTGSALANGFYYSILLMLAVPFSMMAGFGWAFYRRIQKVAVIPPPHDAQRCCTTDQSSQGVLDTAGSKSDIGSSLPNA